MRVIITAILIAAFIHFGYASNSIKTARAIQKEIAALEATTDGRIGVYLIKMDGSRHIQYRANERFPLCSTGKVVVVSAVLKQSMSDRHLLKKIIKYTKEDVALSGYAPITQNHIRDGMRIGDLCQAAITHSDNAAMNLIMKQVGGPHAVTAFAKSMHDASFRLDRYEPQLNSAIPGELFDTSTPKSMATSLKKLAFGHVLGAFQRKQLLTWLKNNTTGSKRIRAWAPNGWLVADKTGTGGYGSTHDIGIIWPPHGPPIIVAIYFTQYKKNATPRDDIIKSVTRILLGSL